LKQNAETNSKVGAACQAGLAVDLIVGLAATRLPGKGLKIRRAYSTYIIGGTQLHSTLAA